MVAKLVVAAVGRVDIGYPHIDIGQDPQGLQFPQYHVAQHPDQREEPLAYPPGAGFPVMPALVGVRHIFDQGGAEHATDTKGMEQGEKHEAQAAEAPEKGLGMGGGDGEDTARGAAVDNIRIGGAAVQQPGFVVKEFFAKMLDVVGVVAADQLPGGSFEPAEGGDAATVAVKNRGLGGGRGARQAGFIFQKDMALIKIAPGMGHVA